MSKEPNREAFERALSDAPDPVLQPGVVVAPPDMGALAVSSPASTALEGVEYDGSLTPYIDECGFDPADYRWVAVRRRPRKDGWSEAKQRLFIEQLADTACVETAAQAVGMSVRSAYALRRAPGGEAFAAAWSAAIQQGALRLVDIAFDRAIHGSNEPVFDKEGHRVGRRMRQNDRLLMFLLRAHLPERYRHANRDSRHAAESLPEPAEPVARAIARLEPPVPAEPHKLLDPEGLDCAIHVADMCDGALPPWCDPRPREVDPAISPLGEDFERLLAEAKGEPVPGDEEDEDEGEGEDEEEDEDDAGLA